MGPSGAGKTSLLNVLAGRVRSRGNVKVDGSILLDNLPISGSALRKRIAYVMQQDILTPTQTVRESLWFSANLRLPKSYSRKEKEELVGLALLSKTCFSFLCLERSITPPPFFGRFQAALTLYWLHHRKVSCLAKMLCIKRRDPIFAGGEDLERIGFGEMCRHLYWR